MKTVHSYGDKIQAPFAAPHPTKRKEFVTEYREATIVGFSHPSQAKRDWGWRGDILVEYATGGKAWVGMPN